MNTRRFRDLSDDQFQQIHKVCEAFECELNAGSDVSIEDHLRAASPETQTHLFRELLAIELELRGRRHDFVELGRYVDRFPYRESEVRRVFEELFNSEKNAESPCRVVFQSDMENISTERSFGATWSNVNAARGLNSAPTGSSHGYPAHEGSRENTPRYHTENWFRIIQSHAQGGLGEVFLAQDENLDRQIAIKEIRPQYADNAERRARFLLEARTTGALEHPGIVPIYGLGQYRDGRPYYAMRFIRGDTLQKAIAAHHDSKPSDDAEKAVSLRKLLRRFIDVCNAIHYAHRHNVLHRDLKPANIMLGEYGETMVVDWGLAKVMQATTEDEGSVATTVDQTHTLSSSTQDGSALGTPAYMAPEQAEGRLDRLGPKTDVYSLGATLYELLTGARAFSDRNVVSLLEKVQQGKFRTPRQVRRDVPKPLEAICLKSMSKSPSDRYESAVELADDIERFLAGEAVNACVEPVSIRARRWLRKHPRLVAGMAALVAAVVVGAIVVSAIVANKNDQLAGANQQLRNAHAEAIKANKIANARQKEAETARRKEAAARKRAESVSNYLVKIFRSPDPAVDGRNVTIASVLDRFALDLQKGAFADEPDTRAQMLEAIGASYMGLGLHQKGIMLLKQVHEIKKATCGQNHDETLAAKSSLAGAYLAVWDVAKAIPLLEQTLKEFRTSKGDDHRRTLAAMNLLGTAYAQAGQTQKSLPLLKKILNHRTATLGNDHPDTMQSRRSLAFAHQNSGNSSKAIPLLQTVFEWRRQQSGADHPSTLAAMHNLATAMASVRDHDNARKMLENAVARMRRVLGDNHPKTLTSMNVLANLYRTTGDYAKAVSLFTETLKRRRDALGNKNPHTLASMQDLALTLQTQGDLESALPLFVESAVGHKAVFGHEHQWTLAAMNRLGVARMTAGDAQKALPLFENVLQLRRKTLGESHPETLESVYNLATACEAASRFDEAEPLRQSLVRQARAKSPHGFEFAMSLSALARCLLVQKKFAQTELVCRECLSLDPEFNDRWQMHYVRSLLGAALDGQGKFPEAERMLLAGYEGIKECENPQLAVQMRRLTESLYFLVNFYKNQHAIEKAAQWRQKLKKQEMKTPKQG